MNSIFNAAQQSAYFEEESTADIIKALEIEDTCREMEPMGTDGAETGNVAMPAIGTAVQQYKKSIKSPKKAKSLSPRQSLGKARYKLSKKMNGNKTSNANIASKSCAREVKQPRNLNVPPAYNVNFLRSKYDDDSSNNESNKPIVNSRTTTAKNRRGNEVGKNLNTNMKTSLEENNEFHIQRSTTICVL
jgi:hypothetical protein